MNSSSPSWTNYVDIHGRDLKATMASDGSIFIPLNEIRKSGFHVFSRSEFLTSNVSKSMVMNEFRMYLLGAAKEFLIQNNINSLKKEDILETIEKCREQLYKDDQMIGASIGKPGLLGRTLLSDPVTINKEVRSSLQRSNQQILDDSFHKNEHRDNRLRLPHHKGKLSNNQSPQQQSGNRNRMNGNFSPNASFAARRDDCNRTPEIKRDDINKTNSEIDESETFLRLSDCKIERTKLQKNTQRVKVVYIETSNDKKKYWVHLVENEDKMLDITEKCLDASVYSPVYTPKLGDICMAMSAEDELWNRVVVQRATPMIKVHFIDFGNNAVVPKVKKIPDELRTVFAQAVRIVFPNDSGPKLLKVDDVVAVKVIKEFPDATVLVSEDVTDKDMAALPRITSSGGAKNDAEFGKCYWTRNVYCKDLVDQEVVRVIAYKDGKFYLQNINIYNKFKAIAAFIKDLPKQPVKSVERKQLVLCRKDGSDQMCRAVIQDVDDGFVTIQYIDFNTNDSMSIKALYAAPKALAEFPVPLIESPTIKGYSCDVELSDHAESIIDDVILKRKKFIVSMKGNDFDLLMDGKPFSQLLFSVNNPSDGICREPPSSLNSFELSSSSLHTTPSPSQLRDEPTTKAVVEESKRTMFEAMASYEAPIGLGDYMLTVYKDSQDFTITSTGDVESDLLSKCTCIEVDENEGPYEPLETEMVLARFEGGWYRGAVLEAVGDEKYEILFVEYGNIVELTKEDIRKLPKSFISIPMLGLMCKMDVPQTEAVKKRLAQLLKTENIYEVDIISLDTENALHTVQIPKVLNILRKEGLL